uniref:Crinia-angiotensin-2 n=1 Tax=Crinia georgiana TaxID=8374 RepID=ANGT_CRIGE|nr:RecName: Full=Crinia-angiotensin-2; AltName: Full=Crinia-angiotensin II [Crinia georgiana]
APGDRIYVHPF